MKTHFNILNIFGKKTFLLKMAGLFLLALLMHNTSAAQEAPPGVVTAPEWAPPYDNVGQVQYYYIPDIEVYYDVWNHEFVYLENGNWLFSPTLPAMYSWYDLRNGHTVVLDRQVHQPWLHHELYVSHYPRYYHHVVYGKTVEHPHTHGYDENTRKPLYNPHATVVVEKEQPARRTPVQYKDKNVGQPVKVEKEMMRPVVHEKRK